jgi:trehalose 6-phosphate phosphatase
MLAAAHQTVLEQFAWSNVLLAFDFDGTLAPIVDRPERAVMREATRKLVERVATIYPCIVISGRSQVDVMRRMRGTGIHEVIGNHGIEPWRASHRMLEQVQRWRLTLDGALAGLRGVELEDKLFSVAIHYRRSREKSIALATIREAIRRLDGVRVVGGKQVINLLPAGGPHKGTALLRSRSRLGCDTAIFVGDDETDEDVFTLDQPGQLLTVRVGRRKSSAAAYFVPKQSDIDELLQILIEVRAKAGIARAPWRGR